MTEPPCTTHPCGLCHQPHPRVHGHGYEAEHAPGKWHPWTPPTTATPTPEAERGPMFEADAFGLAYVCTVCADGVLRSGRLHHMTTHREWHERMESL